VTRSKPNKGVLALSGFVMGSLLVGGVLLAIQTNGSNKPLVTPKVETPSVLGYSIGAAESVLHRYGLKGSFTLVQNWSNPSGPLRPFGTVLNQRPVAGSTVHLGSVVHIDLVLARFGSWIEPCRTAQLRASVTSSYRNVQLSHYEIGVDLTNIGAICFLDDHTPGVQAVRGNAHKPVGYGSANDLMWKIPIVLAHGESSAATIFVVNNRDLRARCHSVNADGLLLFDGLPYGTSRFIRHIVPGVCSSTSVGNVGASDYGPAFYIGNDAA
jgi:hypothetical protein